jgi:hypothetical protein
VDVGIGVDTIAVSHLTTVVPLRTTIKLSLHRSCSPLFERLPFELATEYTKFSSKAIVYI